MLIVKTIFTLLFAASIARELDKLARNTASFTSATATLGTGPVDDSNTGDTCTGDTVLLIEMIGEFTMPHGHTSTAPSAGEDDGVHAVLITADAVSGEPCLISVQTGQRQPGPGAVVLFTS